MTLKPRLLRIAAAAAFSLTFAASPARADNKDMVQLETRVQLLLDAVARLQQSNDERMGALKDLVQQSADSVNRLSLNMDALQKQMRAAQDAEGNKLDQVSNQVQSLNDSLDEMKARVARLDKAMQDLQSQQQSINSTLQNIAPAAGGSASPLTSPTAPAPQPVVDPTRRGKPSAGVPATPAPFAPPADDLYKSALGDYMAAKYPLALIEFNDLTKAYPDNALSGNAFYYLGEIEYRDGHYAAAEKDYDKVLEQFPGNSKIPAAQLHKGQALIVQKQNEAGVREFRSLIGRYPNSPEAVQARSKLNAMGVPITARR